MIKANLEKTIKLTLATVGLTAASLGVAAPQLVTLSGEAADRFVGLLRSGGVSEQLLEYPTGVFHFRLLSLHCRDQSEGASCTAEVPVRMTEDGERYETVALGGEPSQGLLAQLKGLLPATAGGAVNARFIQCVRTEAKDDGHFSCTLATDPYAAAPEG